MENKRTTIEDFQKLKESIIPEHEERFLDFISGLVSGVVVAQEITGKAELVDELMFHIEEFCNDLWRDDMKPNIDGLMTMVFDKPKDA